MTEILYKDLSYRIVGAAMEVHRVLGAGYLEAIYEQALALELADRNLPFERQRRLSVLYKGTVLGEYVADIVVEDKVILELKAVSSLNDAHRAQARHYLAATGLRLAILLNFGAESLQHERVVL
ncbi:MAG: GxxExxY protein [Anaerolineae bacterium]|nr:GxxExxY protein [Anaerolineae bacterium]